MLPKKTSELSRSRISQLGELICAHKSVGLGSDWMNHFQSCVTVTLLIS